MTALHLSTAEFTQDERASWRRGVLALYGPVTNGRRDYDFPRLKVTIRDAVIAGLTVAGMWGLQIATQSKTQGAIETLVVKVDGYMATQATTNMELQRQIDDTRRTANLALVNDAQTAKELAELKGFLAGSGVKGAKR